MQLQQGKQQDELFEQNLRTIWKQLKLIPFNLRFSTEGSFKCLQFAGKMLR